MSLILSTVSSQYQTTIPLNIRKQRLVLNDVPEQCRRVQALIRDKDRRFRIATLPSMTQRTVTQYATVGGLGTSSPH